jgi:hypothetical protein
VLNAFAHPKLAIDHHEAMSFPYSFSFCDLLPDAWVRHHRQFQKMTVLAYNSNEKLNFSQERFVPVYFSGSLNPRFWLQDGRIVRRAIVRAFGRIVGARYLHIARKGPEVKKQATGASVQRECYFCVVPVGDSPSSKRLYDTFRTGCIGIVMSDLIRLPFEEVFIKYENVLVQIAQDRTDLIQHAMMRMNDRWRSVFHGEMIKIRDLLDLTVDAGLREGDHTWGWLWMEFFKASYIGTWKRRKIMFGRKYLV